MAELIKIGLTGGIATGKSTVARQWAGNGAAVIDSDELAHQALATDTPTGQEVIRQFGRQVLKSNGSIDRACLGEIVFSDEQKRLALNRIIHPAVRRMWTDALEQLKSEGRAEPAVVVIPLLYEVGAEKEFDVVVVTACSEETQRARLAGKGLSDKAATARIRAQWPNQRKMDRADYVIWNDGSQEMLRRQADIIWATIKENNHAPTEERK